LRIAVAASGGGHTGYAAALAGELARRGAALLYILEPGDEWSRRRLLRVAEAPVLHLPRLRAPGEPLLAALRRRAALVSASVVRLAARLRRLRVDALVCTGSNHSLLAAAAARLAGVERVYCTEAIDRLVTRSRTAALLHDTGAALVLLHWPRQRLLHPRGALVGPIVPRPTRRPRPPPPGGYVLVLTGTVGNPRLIRLLLETRLENVVVQTGRLTPPDLVARARPGWRVIRYTTDPGPLIEGARLVLSHQGLGLAEAALAYRRPVLLAFNPDLHMTSGWGDAVQLARHLGTEAVNPAEASPEELEEAIRRAAERRPPRYPDGAAAAAEAITGGLL